MLPILNGLPTNMLLPNSNVFISTVENDSIVYFYEVYRKFVGGNLVIKTWGLWTNGNFLSLKANKWARRRDLDGVKLRVSTLDVRKVVTVKAKEMDSSAAFLAHRISILTLSTHVHYLMNLLGVSKSAKILEGKRY